jgi:hypothetical protein
VNSGQTSVNPELEEEFIDWCETNLMENISFKNKKNTIFHSQLIPMSKMETEKMKRWIYDYMER